MKNQKVLSEALLDSRFEHPASLPAASRRQRFVFILGEEPFSFRMEMAWVAMWNADGAEEWRKLTVRMQVAGAKRHRADTVADQMAGSRSNRGDPFGDVMWVADRR